MKYVRGTVAALRQHGGCVEVEVTGDKPGAFIIDNCCFGIIAANEGTNWIGRPVEYEDAHMRFLDLPETTEEPASEDHTSLPALP